MTDKERIEFLESERIKEMQNKAKLFKRIGMSFFGSLPFGIFLSFFGFNPMNKLLETYGINAVYVVISFIIVSGFYFSIKSSKIEDSIKRYNETLR